MDVEKALPVGFPYGQTNPLCENVPVEICQKNIVNIRMVVLSLCVIIVIAVCCFSPKYYNLSGLKWTYGTTPAIYTTQRIGFGVYNLINNNGEKCGSVTNHDDNYKHHVIIKDPNENIIIKEFNILIDSGRYPSDSAIPFTQYE